MQNEIVKEAILAAGGVNVVAAKLGVTRQNIYNTMKGTTNPSKELLDLLQLERVVTYRKKGKKK